MADIIRLSKLSLGVAWDNGRTVRVSDTGPAEHKEATMRTLPQTETPISQMSLGWVTDRIARTIAAVRPRYLASQIATVVAASGNPSGA
jgi:hypothetical protein